MRRMTERAVLVFGSHLGSDGLFSSSFARNAAKGAEKAVKIAAREGKYSHILRTENGVIYITGS